jgi:hypothetical protein
VSNSPVGKEANFSPILSTVATSALLSYLSFCPKDCSNDDDDDDDDDNDDDDDDDRTSYTIRKVLKF